MSHATLLIAPTKEQISNLGGKIENVIAWEMQPFDENEEWFRDGSRWDWYSLGGRSTGLLSGYEPWKDPANMETCDLCNGTGTRLDGMKVADGCNGCSGKGERQKWPTQWEDHSGDVAKVAQVLEWAQQGKIRKYEDTPVGTNGEPVIPASAFLRNRHWHESERMGWFGTSIRTECELADMQKPKGDPQAWFGKCLHKDEKMGAQIVVWNEPWEIWTQSYFHRFIRPLDMDDTIIVVDYHV